MSEIKVYKFNDYEWIAGPDWPKTIRWYFNETGVSVDEGLDEDAHELTPEEMAATMFVDREGEFGEDHAEYTFEKALEMMLGSRRALGWPEGEPFHFAGTEW